MPSAKAETFQLKKLAKNGPAGWKCQCCNPMGCHPRNMKTKARRMVRHVMKHRVAKETKEIE
ncbi:MAG: hypothetical protein WC869_00120 [Phycisphaerae bacterium]|jgi:hypothetical protein